MSLLEKISQMLQTARDAGATPADLNEMRRYFKMNSTWSPTKKSFSFEEQKRVRKMQKEARRRNRGTGKGQKNRKGQQFKGH